MAQGQQRVIASAAVGLALAAIAALGACATSDPIDGGSTSGGDGDGDDGPGGAGTTTGVGQGGQGSGATTGTTGTTTSTGGPVCGDGNVDPLEECDDDNQLSGDGCDGCVIECESLGQKNPANGHCYRVFANTATWGTAEASCQAWGGGSGLGHLVSLGDVAEQAYVRTMVTDASWIGGADGVTEGVYSWVDGTPWTYELWAANEPNDTTVEDCVFMRIAGTWDDHDCTATWPAFVCERRGAGTF